MSLCMPGSSQVSVESWVEVDEDVRLEVETNLDDDFATLFFGSRNDFVLRMYRRDLATLLRVAGQAHSELEAHAAAWDSANPDAEPGDSAD